MRQMQASLLLQTLVRNYKICAFVHLWCCAHLQVDPKDGVVPKPPVEANGWAPNAGGAATGAAALPNEKFPNPAAETNLGKCKHNLNFWHSIEIVRLAGVLVAPSPVVLALPKLKDAIAIDLY